MRVVFEVEPRLPVLALRIGMILEEAAIVVIRGIGRIDARNLEGRAFVAARIAGVPVDRVIVVVELEVDALGAQLEVAVGVREVAGDPQRPSVIAAADRELIGVGFAVGRALEAPCLERVAGTVDVPADDLIAVVAEDEIGRRSAPDRLRPHGVVDALAIALPQPLGVQLEVAVAELQRAVDRWTPAFALIVMDFGPVGRSPALRVIGDEEAVAADRILVVEARVGEIDQRPELALAHGPAVAEQEVAIDRCVARLVGPHHPEGPGDFQAREVERPARAHIDEAGDARLDQVRGGRLEGFDGRHRAGREVLQRDRARLRGEQLAAVVGGRVKGVVEAAHEHAAGFAAVALDLDAGDACRRVGHRDVGQLADVFGNDRIDDLVAVALDVARRLHRSAKAGDDDASRHSLRRVRVLRRLRGVFLRRRVRDRVDG